MVARRAHNPKVVGSSPASATRKALKFILQGFFYVYNLKWRRQDCHPSPVETGVPALEYPFRVFIPLLRKSLGLNLFVISD